MTNATRSSTGGATTICPSDPRRPWRTFVLGGLVLAVSLVYFYSYHDYGISPFDEGVLLQGIQLHGEGRMDFAKFAHYTALYGFFAWISPGGRPDLELVRLVWVPVRALTTLLLLLLATRVVPTGWRVLPVLCFLALPGQWDKSFVPLALCLCLHAMLRVMESGSRLAHCWLGCCVSLAIAVHPYTGLLSLAAWAALVALLPEARGPGGSGSAGWRGFARTHGSFAAAVVVLTPLLADFLREAPLSLLTFNSRAVAAHAPGSLVLLQRLLRSANDPRVAGTLSLYAVVPLLLLSALWLARSRGSTDLDPVQRRAVVCLAVVTLANLVQWVARPDLAHLLRNAGPVWVLSAFLLHRLVAGLRPPLGEAGPRPRRQAPRFAAAGALGVWLACMVVLGATHHAEEVGSVGTRLLHPSVPLAHPHGVLHVNPYQAEQLQKLVDVVEQNSAENDYILVPGTVPILHYLARRRSPVVLPVFGLPQCFIASPPEELVAEIRQKKTKLIVYQDKPAVPIEAFRLANSAPPLYRLIMDDYELLTTVGRNQVRVLRGAAPPAGDGALAD